MESGAPAAATPNRWAGVVQSAAFRGDTVDHVVDDGAIELRVRTGAGRAAAAGDSVTVTFPDDAFVLLAEE